MGSGTANDNQHSTVEDTIAENLVIELPMPSLATTGAMDLRQVPQGLEVAL